MRLIRHVVDVESTKRRQRYELSSHLRVYCALVCCSCKYSFCESRITMTMLFAFVLIILVFSATSRRFFVCVSSFLRSWSMWIVKSLFRRVLRFDWIFWTMIIDWFFHVVQLIRKRWSWICDQLLVTNLSLNRNCCRILKDSRFIAKLFRIFIIACCQHAYRRLWFVFESSLWRYRARNTLRMSLTIEDNRVKLEMRCSQRSKNEIIRFRQISNYHESESRLLKTRFSHVLILTNSWSSLALIWRIDSENFFTRRFVAFLILFSRASIVN
jgi:hypothetical protein